MNKTNKDVTSDKELTELVEFTKKKHGVSGRAGIKDNPVFATESSVAKCEQFFISYFSLMVAGFRHSDQIKITIERVER